MIYFHGVKIEENTDIGASVNGASPNVIGIIGTAEKGENDRPIVISEPSKLEEIFGKESLGYTLVRSIKAIYESCQPKIVAVKIDFVAPASPAETPTHPYVPTEGELKKVAGDKAAGDGVFSFLKSDERPKIFLAPYFCQDNTVCNHLSDVAAHFRGVALIDPSFDEAKDKGGEEIFKKRTEALTGFSRQYTCYPWVDEASVKSWGKMPLSPFIAGLMASIPFYMSPSNRIIKGVRSVTRLINYTLGIQNPLADGLNEVGVNIVINQSGLRFWGNRTLGALAGASEGEKAQKFINTRRISDAINDSIAISSLTEVDQNMNRAFQENMVEKINAYMRDLKSTGAIINGRCWIDKKDNPSSSLTNGAVTFTFDFTTPPPAESITFKSRLTAKYLEEIFA